MRIFRGATAAAALSALSIVATCWTAQAQQSSVQGRTFRSGVDVTGITVSVRDADGHLVQDLTRDDFEIYEDGEKQPLTQFTEERVPVSLGVLLDISDRRAARLSTTPSSTACRSSRSATRNAARC